LWNLFSSEIDSRKISVYNYIVKLKIKCRSGFTYIEALLAIAILPLVILAFAQVFYYRAIAVKQAKIRTVASSYASDAMEETKELNFSNIGDPFYPTVWQTDSKELISGITFTRTITISSIDSDLKRIDIQVEWTQGGETKSISLSSYVTQTE